MSNQRPLTLLGPQPEYHSLRHVIERAGFEGPVALNTSGWETEESDDEALRAAVPVDCVNLNLFARSEQLFTDDKELIETLRARQDELRHLRDVYNDRLEYMLTAARKVIRKQGALIDLTRERESAIEMIRQLDREYLLRTEQIIDRYEEQLNTSARPAVEHHRREIAGLLSGVSAILISGGHVAIILNRLKIFGILEMNPQLPVIAWSGGAMALSAEVIFFHDSPPQGAGNAEVLRAGMGLFGDVLPLPSARTRLKLDDRARVELFARRFDRYKCVVFDPATILIRSGDGWVTEEAPVEQLGIEGCCVEAAL
ncbi:MAG: hypothetical protein AAF456_03125 [Planctomycetota bacterium]